MSGGALAILDAACCVLALDKTADPNRRLEQVREDFAELIEAVRAGVEVQTHNGSVLKFDEVQSGRLAAAVARVTGGAK